MEQAWNDFSAWAQEFSAWAFDFSDPTHRAVWAAIAIAVGYLLGLIVAVILRFMARRLAGLRKAAGEQAAPGGSADRHGGVGPLEARAAYTQ